MHNISKDMFIKARHNTSNIVECAKLLGTSVSTIHNLRKRFDIPKIITQSSSCPKHLTRTQMEVLTGSMLGDGSLSKVYKKANSLFCERHSHKQLEYLEWKFEVFKPFSRGIRKEIIDGSRLPSPGSFDEYVSYKMETVRHQLFSEIEGYWYKRKSSGQYITDRLGRRIKIIPKDLVISDMSLAVWFADDGRMIHPRKLGIISTDGFDYNECEIMCAKIIPLGIKANVTQAKKGRWEIAISTKSYNRMCQILQSYVPCKCIAYKHTRSITNP